jgi:transposase
VSHDRTSREKELEARVASLTGALAARDETIALLQKQVEALTAAVGALEGRLGANSSNSSRPPSSDPPWKKSHVKKAPSKRKEKGKRKRGGQRGHKGSARSALPPEQVDAYVTVTPASCAGCGLTVPDDSELWLGRAQQVTEIPTPVLHTTEYQFMACRCPGCGEVNEAADTEGVTRSAFGPNIHALTGILTGRFRMSRRNVSGALATLYGLDVSTGAVQNMVDRVSEAIAATVDQVASEVHRAPSVHADETSWPFDGGKGWLWVATTPSAAYFHIDAHRSRDALSNLLPPDYSGIVHSDRWRPYEVYPFQRRQLCHAHLRRDFQALIDRGGHGRPIGKGLLKASDRLFHLWHRFKRGDITRSQLWRDTEAIRTRWSVLAQRAKSGSHQKARALSKDLLRQWAALWTFLRVDGVEPTNNDAERALRHGVIWRKLSFGSDSPKGAQFVGRILTIVETARRRGVNLLHWMKQAIAAARRSVPAPRLLPA